ncbi:2-keto-4-pentenoate hydratase [Alicyclobacillus cycloheptanicus]|uniref:2-oxopent-4-enoate hydratase n=1 Tax=Alicyclobacillus cycloheptanicus TaxID=1457 RepID=A0ABT9XIZ2_9BACL|nr:2-keto-4-pentenoate hydratase [Alicyclobacillus cycloheptanicus]MDQ0190282.1 2-oxopent-4-enoate hydratase [Alicyclobacillus cycloheptanicus]
MAGSTQSIPNYAEALYEAERNLKAIAPLSAEDEHLTVEDAYQIQLYNVARKTREGDRVVGYKVGLTSQPMQQMLGVPEPDFGHLFASMHYQSGDVVEHPLIQPKVEPEIAFLLKEDLSGGRISVQDVIQAIAYVLPALEIIDSRVTDWNIRLVDTVADNASAGCFALGDMPTDIHNVDLGTVGGTLRVNGQVVETGAGAAVLGHPAASVAWLANKLNALGTTLQKGSVILSGSVSSAVPVKPGDRVSLSFGRLGRVAVTLRA